MRSGLIRLCARGSQWPRHPPSLRTAAKGEQTRFLNGCTVRTTLWHRNGPGSKRLRRSRGAPSTALASSPKEKTATAAAIRTLAAGPSFCSPKQTPATTSAGVCVPK
eukprot:scaffold2908_cov257-Pinguiococcus_pyrenoidosus.AAC.43